MPRSPESLERRREYGRRWRLAHPDYHKRWREDHACEERERVRRWRNHNRDLVRAQKLRYYLTHLRPAKDPDPLPPKFYGHEFFETARLICGHEPVWKPSVYVWEESMAEAVLALVEGRDPEAAVAAARRRERNWGFRTGPLYDNVDIREDTRDVIIVRRREYA